MNVDAAKKKQGGDLRTIIPQVMGLIEKGFAAKYGIKTEYWRADATKVIDRVLTEWRRQAWIRSRDRRARAARAR